MEPLVVVDGGPVEQAADVDAPCDGVVHDLEAASEVVRALGVVGGADPELGDEERGPGEFDVEAIEDESDSLGVDPVPERRDASCAFTTS